MEVMNIPVQLRLTDRGPEECRHRLLQSLDDLLHEVSGSEVDKAQAAKYLSAVNQHLIDYFMARGVLAYPAEDVAGNVNDFFGSQNPECAIT
ncbi:hypothetical protein SAMN02799630_02845 [Paenibacillus sp. UNCCL117]|uniref:hypothetical protein n=1 Tax=unclassified Paenibacillus TaxID=185978 RepID=UPI00087E11C3|nr:MULTISPECIES: hypothetical protein [unclassified Paenibacillus]SDD28254.1 hypothetical protein SAMN04488602_107146 [Paenibacillus sp. cl123]SFW40941.1 hypothetical protein SAMN02799630_02845 [Paenibacillus sp. UNCCL117]